MLLKPTERFPLQLQFFAETDPKDEEPNGKTHDDAEQLRNDILNLKKSLEQSNSENKKYKDQLKAKLSDEEKKASEIEEREKYFKDIEMKYNNSLITQQFIKGGFEEKEITEVINTFNGNITPDIATAIVSLIDKKIEQKVKIKMELLTKGMENLPPNQRNGTGNSELSMGEKLAKELSPKAKKEIKI